MPSVSMVTSPSRAEADTCDVVFGGHDEGDKREKLGPVRRGGERAVGLTRRGYRAGEAGSITTFEASDFVTYYMLVNTMNVRRATDLRGASEKRFNEFTTFGGTRVHLRLADDDGEATGVPRDHEPPPFRGVRRFNCNNFQLRNSTSHSTGYHSPARRRLRTAVR